MKKTLSILLAALMIFAFSVTALAADSESTPTDPLASHTYTAYQIFSGTQGAEETDVELGSIDWGDGVRKDDLLSALKGSSAFGTPNPFASCATASEAAKIVAEWADDSAEAKALAKLAYACIKSDGGTELTEDATLEAGYYLVVDTTEGSSDPIYNLALLQQTKKGAFEIRTKVEVPEVEKKIVEGEADVDSNNAAIGDTVTFKISSQVPAKATDYDYYYFIIEDTLSTGLKLNADSIVVTIGSSEAAADTDYTLISDTESFKIALIDAVANAGKNVVVAYTAEVDTDAKIGTSGNPNEVIVRYSNKPNAAYTGTTDTDHPGFPKTPGEDEPEVPTGETPPDYTITYVTGIRVFKVDEDEDPLTGAAFTLYEGENVIAPETAVDEDGIVTFSGLKAGEYTLKESTVPDGYNPIDDIAFTITWAEPEDGVTEGSEYCTWSGSSNVSYDSELNLFTITVKNQKGSVMPETGSFGTKMFFLAGAVLAVAAAVVLVTRKRMSKYVK